MSTPESGRFRFGLFEFDSATGELRREGALVRLQSQPAQVLRCLVERAGQVVSRDELSEAVWGGETFVDFERGLNFCISQVRSALNDNPTEPTFIRTIPKQGYRFIAPLERISHPVDQGHKLTASAQTWQSARALVLLAGVLVGIAFLTAYWFRFKTAKVQPPIIAVLRFDNETGNPDLTRFSDNLTDNVVEQLTSLSNRNYSVIGNAQILRLPREQRDLKAIASSLHAAYVVLGQVQSNGTQVRILAHLIRFPGQTHMWVTRIDRTLADSMGVESEAAHMIATEFSARAAIDTSPAAVSHPAATR